MANTDVNNQVQDIWNVIKWVAEGVLALVGVVLSALIGNHFKEHKLLIEDYKERHGKSAMELKEKNEEEDKKLKEDISDTKHRLNAMFKQIEIAFEKWNDKDKKLVMLEEQILGILQNKN